MNIKYYLRTTAVLLLTLSMAGDAKGQELPASQITWDAGLEIQAYPTGIIPGFTAELGWKQRNAAHIRVGYNLFDHRDLGVHEAEEGSGPGFTLGYRRYFRDGGSGLWIGARADVWFNGVTWCDGCDSPGDKVTGTTELLVLQPTAEAGWLFALAQGNLGLGPSLGFGWEWNAVTDGAPTGEGAILLLGLRAQYRVR